MMMKNSLPLLLTFFFVCGASFPSAQGQYISSTSRLSYVPQHTDLMPGSRPKLKGWLGMTGLSGVTLRVDNTLLHPAGLFSPGPNGGTILRIDPLIAQWSGPDNRLALSNSLELASFGFSGGEHGESIWSVRIRERVEVDGNLPGDLLVFPFTGNPGGSTVDLSALSLRAIHFREYSFGWNRAWGEFLNTGLRVNYLYGMEYAELTDFDASWSTDPTDFSYALSASGQFRSSGLNSIAQTEDSLEHYLLFRDNRGWSLDAGLRLAISEKATVGLHVVDWGSIRWVEDVESTRLAPTTFDYHGPTISGEDALSIFDGDSLMNWLDAEANRLDSLFLPASNSEAFDATLPIRVVGEGEFEVRNTEASVTRLHGVWVGRYAHGALSNWQLSLGAVHEWKRKLGLSVSYNQFSTGFGSLGAGLSLNLGMFQWYLAADNLLLTPWTELVMNENTIPLPNRADVINLQTGFNLVFGRKPLKDKDKPAESGRTARRKGLPCEDFMAGGGR
jgi:hypothetical protein